MEQNNTLKTLKKADLDQIMTFAQLYHFQAGHIMITENTPVEHLYVLIEGSIREAEKNQLLLERPGLWGEFRLDETSDRKNCEETIVFASDSVLMKISIKVILDKLGDRSKFHKDNNSNSHLSDREDIRLTAQSYSDFVKHHTLNENKVYRYEMGIFKGQTNPVMLKIISKTQVESRGLKSCIRDERKLLQDSKFPFIVPLIGTLMGEDDKQTIYIMKYVDGTTLYELIRTVGLLGSFDCQFYTASILLILLHLMEFKMIHRDIKPENFLVDNEGYLHLFDCSVAKVLQAEKQEKTVTIIGTPHYMAPEIIRNQPYSYEVDIWSTGICVYEFMCGKVPFGDNNEDPFYIFEEILEGDLVFPNSRHDSKIQQVIMHMLERNPKNREKFTPQWLLRRLCFVTLRRLLF